MELVEGDLCLAHEGKTVVFIEIQNAEYANFYNSSSPDFKKRLNDHLIPILV